MAQFAHKGQCITVALFWLELQYHLLMFPMFSKIIISKEYVQTPNYPTPNPTHNIPPPTLAQGGNSSSRVKCYHDLSL